MEQEPGRRPSGSKAPGFERPRQCRHRNVIAMVSGRMPFSIILRDLEAEIDAMADANEARADERARKLAPVIKAIQAEGITSLNGIAEALNERRVPTPRGRGHWYAMQVRRVLARMEA
jgi:hypothetical protein